MSKRQASSQGQPVLAENKRRRTGFEDADDVRKHDSNTQDAAHERLCSNCHRKITSQPRISSQEQPVPSHERLFTNSAENNEQPVPSEHEKLFIDSAENNKQLVPLEDERPFTGSEDIEDVRQRQADLNPRQAAIPIPTMAATSPWYSPEIPAHLPPLPKISDKELEKTVYCHPGVSIREPSYEKLEWLGDAFLEIISTILIHLTFDQLSIGRCSQLRESLVRNVNLSRYFREYGLHFKAQLPATLNVDVANGRGKSKDKDIVKVHADMFEAYVAAAIISDPEHGLQNTITWLKALFSRTIKDEIARHEKEQLTFAGSSQDANALSCNVNSNSNSNVSASNNSDTNTRTNTNAKDRLRAEIGYKGVMIRYEDLPGPKKDKVSRLPLFTVGCFLDGWGERDKLLGVGSALGKSEAGMKAAMRALENKKLMKALAAKKNAMKQAQQVADNAA